MGMTPESLKKAACSTVFVRLPRPILAAMSVASMV